MGAEIGTLGPVASIIIRPRRLQKHPFMKSNIRCTKGASCLRKMCKKRNIFFGSNSCAKIVICPRKSQKEMNFFQILAVCAKFLHTKIQIGLLKNQGSGKFKSLHSTWPVAAS